MLDCRLATSTMVGTPVRLAAPRGASRRLGGSRPSAPAPPVARPGRRCGCGRSLLGRDGRLDRGGPLGCGRHHRNRVRVGRGRDRRSGNAVLERSLQPQPLPLSPSADPGDDRDRPRRIAQVGHGEGARDAAFAVAVQDPLAVDVQLVGRAVADPGDREVDEIAGAGARLSDFEAGVGVRGGGAAQEGEQGDRNCSPRVRWPDPPWSCLESNVPRHRESVKRYQAAVGVSPPAAGGDCAAREGGAACSSGSGVREAASTAARPSSPADW